MKTKSSSVTVVTSKEKKHKKGKINHIASKHTKLQLDNPSSPEAAPSNPVLTDILHICGLRKELINLVGDIKFLVVLEVTSSQLFLHASKHLDGAGILGLPSLGRDAFLCIEDTTFQDRGSAVTREVAWLHTICEINAFDNRLAAFSRKRHAIGRFLGSKTPINQGIVNELENELELESLRNQYKVNLQLPELPSMSPYSLEGHA